MVISEALSSIVKSSFCFVAIFGIDIANFIFDPKIQGQGHDKNWPKSSQVISRSGPSILSKMKEIQKLIQKLSCEQKSVAGDITPEALYKSVQKHKSHPDILQWLN